MSDEPKKKDAPGRGGEREHAVSPDEATAFPSEPGASADEAAPSDPEISTDYDEQRLPKEIGGYQITRVLGQGGMSVVYAALQKQPRRPVALKVMKGEVEADRAIRRFKREVEILGKLNHRCIAQVFDAGTHDDGSGARPFFVMEYVPSAKTIIQFCEEKSLDVKDRLKLFVMVCAAIEHGHRNKIVHRDLKPSNILIDPEGTPKVIDFGVARALELDVTSQTVQTEAGRLVGTIQYMSPEQVNAGPTDIDPRSDVYALGVLLYKLLTGRHCYNLEGLPVYTAVKMICDVTPPKPSELKPELAGDLETIMLKALEKDRVRRYTSAGSLGRDIVRFLAHKPIHARPASLGYRGRLFVIRHRTLFIATAAVLVIAAASTIAVMSSYSSAQRQSEQLAALQDEIKREREARLAAEQAAVPTTDEREAFVLDEHTAGVASLQYSPDGTRLASGSHDYTVMLWDIAQRDLTFVSDNHDATVAHLAFAADGTRLVSAGDDRAIVLLDATGGGLVRRIRHDCARVRCLALSDGGDLVAFGCGDLTVRVLDVAGEQVSVARGTTGGFGAAAFDGDGARLAAGSDGGLVYIFDAARGATDARLEGLSGPVRAVRFIDDDRRLVAVDERGNVAAWKLDSAEAPERFAMCAGRVEAVAFDPAGRVLACARRREAHIRDLETGVTTEVALEENLFISALAIDPERRWLAVGDTGGRIHVVPIPAE